MQEHFDKLCVEAKFYYDYSNLLAMVGCGVMALNALCSIIMKFQKRIPLTTMLVLLAFEIS